MIKNFSKAKEHGGQFFFILTTIVLLKRSIQKQQNIGEGVEEYKCSKFILHRRWSKAAVTLKLTELK